MRQDQYERLQALGEKLMDVFLDEADPESWPGRGLKIGAMDSQTRGDLYWVRKTAASAGMLYTRVMSMVNQVQLAGAGTTPPAQDSPDPAENQLDAEVAAAEKEAQRLLRDIQTGAGKSAFDKRVHGKS
jgi:hypothetical protein